MSVDTRSEFSLTAFAGTTVTVTATWLANGVAYDIDESSLWLGPFTDADNFDDATEIVGEVTGNQAVFEVPVPTLIRLVKMRMTVDGDLATLGWLRPSALGDADTTFDVTVNLEGASVTVQVVGASEGGGGGSDEPAVSILLAETDLTGGDFDTLDIRGVGPLPRAYFIGQTAITESGDDVGTVFTLTADGPCTAGDDLAVGVPVRVTFPGMHAMPQTADGTTVSAVHSPLASQTFVRPRVIFARLHVSDGSTDWIDPDTMELLFPLFESSGPEDPWDSDDGHPLIDADPDNGHGPYRSGSIYLDWQDNPDLDGPWDPYKPDGWTPGDPWKVRRPTYLNGWVWARMIQEGMSFWIGSGKRYGCTTWSNSWSNSVDPGGAHIKPDAVTVHHLLGDTGETVEVPTDGWVLTADASAQRGHSFQPPTGGGVALGETSGTAYRGDRGKAAYDHSQTTGNPHGVTKSDVGLGNVDNTSDANKPVSTATQTALNAKAGWPRRLSIPVSYTPPDADAQGSWGTANLVGTTSVITGAYMRSGTANNESWTWNVDVDAGTWSLDLWHRKGTTGGIVTVTLDGVSLGTVDTYNGSSTNNNRATISGVTVAAAGRYPLVLTNATKNASASDYQMLLHAITGRRTGS